MESDLCRKRKYMPKVRTGCLTCKRRRVKCGEEKPSCQRCIGGGYRCDGYSIPKCRWFDPSTSDLVCTPAVSCVLPLSVHYGTAEETRSLRFFLQRTAPMLSTFFELKDFWTIVVPQSSCSYPEIRHMLVAVSLTDQCLASVSSTPSNQEEYAPAIRHYNQALVSLASGQPSMSCVLLFSMLAWVLEIISSRYQTAALHMRAAMRIVQEHKVKRLSARASHEYELVATAVESSVNRALLHGSTSTSSPTPTSSCYDDASSQSHTPTSILEEVLPDPLDDARRNLEDTMDAV